MRSVLTQYFGTCDLAFVSPGRRLWDHVMLIHRVVCAHSLQMLKLLQEQGIGPRHMRECKLRRGVTNGQCTIVLRSCCAQQVLGSRDDLNFVLSFPMPVANLLLNAAYAAASSHFGTITKRVKVELHCEVSRRRFYARRSPS